MIDDERIDAECRILWTCGDAYIWAAAPTRLEFHIFRGEEYEHRRSMPLRYLYGSWVSRVVKR